MHYSEAVEFNRLMNLDPEVAFADSYKAALEAQAAYQDQMALESTLGAFISDDSDAMESENFEVATEAMEKITNWLKKVAAWFKRLLMRFQAMVRGIMFRRAEASFKKNYEGENPNKKGHYSYEYGTTKKAKGMQKDMEISGLDAIQKDWETLGMPAASLQDTVTAGSLAGMTKSTIQMGIGINKELQDALRDPNSDVDIQELNKKAKAAGRVINKMTSLLNQAAKKGIIQMKNDDKQAKADEKAAKKAEKENKGKPVVPAPPADDDEDEDFDFNAG